ncbi:NAD-dependent protein deacetylase [Archaeoglobus profundus]|uniref:NAD-dependent protein deacylase n=1 Tax=Archaeoglobus profundus (strain DSM 5631 / JCM 9629 / NBRC 100127 / Av18) TaxID=572546 RepID=D2RHT4_ARCPA|nr:NAD-dependent protein deacetylase [Archaeoglobus profundus]ADB57859.1 Silent information regulator protein Sir2 [Archaeoglobus profundus DSM 5631]
MVIDNIARLLKNSKHAVVFTGAGISAESGIPTFRGANGLWSKYDPEEVASIYGFMRNPRAFWAFAKELIVKTKAKPNAGHYAIAELERMGIVKAVITQNIDMLHQKAGSRRVLELHGSLKYVDCLKCGKTYEWEEIISKIDDIKCENCGSLYLKPRIVFFGEQLPRDVLNEAIEEAKKSDLFIVVGSSLQVYPAASLPFIAKESGAKLVLINKDPTDKDWLFDIVVYGKAGEILPKIVEKVKKMI